jgi:hypothetical protein
MKNKTAVRIFLGILFIAILAFARFSFKLPETYLADTDTRHSHYLKIGTDAYKEAIKITAQSERILDYDIAIDALRKAHHFNKKGFHANLYLGKIFLDYPSFPNNERLARYYLRNATDNAKDSREVSHVRDTWGNIDTTKYSTISAKIKNSAIEKIKYLESASKAKFMETCDNYCCANELAEASFNNLNYKKAEYWHNMSIEVCRNEDALNVKCYQCGEKEKDKEPAAKDVAIFKIKYRRFIARYDLAKTYLNQRSRMKDARIEFTRLSEDYEILNSEWLQKNLKLDRKLPPLWHKNLAPKIKLFTDASSIAGSDKPGVVKTISRIFNRKSKNEKEKRGKAAIRMLCSAANDNELATGNIFKKYKCTTDITCINCFDVYSELFESGQVYKIVGDRLKTIGKKKMALDFYDVSIALHGRAEAHAKEEIISWPNNPVKKAEWEKKLVEAEKNKKSVTNAKLPLT